jgi:hypothetical protein
LRSGLGQGLVITSIPLARSERTKRSIQCLRQGPASAFSDPGSGSPVNSGGNDSLDGDGGDDLVGFRNSVHLSVVRRFVTRTFDSPANQEMA